MSFHRKTKDSDTESGEEKESYKNLYESEQDKHYIDSLPELEREKILSDRYEKRLSQKDRERMQMQLELGQERKQPMAEGTDEYSDEDKRGRRKRRKKSDDDYEPLQKPKKKLQILEKQEPAYDYKKESAAVQLEDIEKIRVGRDQLVKWCPHLYFDKTVKGAFVRINIGKKRGTNESIYLMCEVVDVIASDKYYNLPDSEASTNKMLVLAHGKNKKTMKIDIVSKKAFTMEEFDAYTEKLKKDGIKPVTRNHIDVKAADIQTAHNYKYTSEEIEIMVEKQLQENIAKGRIESNATMELEKLKVRLEDIKLNSEGLGEEEQKKKLKTVEEMIRKLELALKFDDKIVVGDIVQRLNERNRNKQLEIDSSRVRIYEGRAKKTAQTTRRGKARKQKG